MLKESFPLKPIQDRTDLFYPDLDLNISKILPTILTLFGQKYPKERMLTNYLKKKESWKKLQEEEISNIIFITLDSLGFDQFLTCSKLMSQKFDSNGIPLSSVFPTITSSCIASLRFGEMPINHGIVGQKIRFSEIDSVVDTLTLKTKTSSTDLQSMGINVKNWLWCDFLIANDPSISHVGLIDFHIANSGLSHLIYKKPISIGYSSIVDCFAAAHKILETPTSARKLLDIYIGSIDAITHRYTNDSQALRDEVENIEQILFRTIRRLDKKIASKTAIVITADHGQERLVGDQKIIVSSEEVEKLHSLLKTRGRSGRVIHLYSKDDKHEEVVDWFSEKVGEKGIIVTPKSYPKLMGKGADSQRVIERIGDVQLILGKNASLFFGHSGDFDRTYDLGLNATHGSLSRDELVVPLIIGSVNDLLDK